MNSNRPTLHMPWLITIAVVAAAACTTPTSQTAALSPRIVPTGTEGEQTNQTATATATATTTTTQTAVINGTCVGICNTSSSCVREIDDLICECVVVPEEEICSGAAREPSILSLQPPQRSWNCRPRDLTRDRGDGCPIGEPAEKGACNGLRRCQYSVGKCGGYDSTWTCNNAKWTLLTSSIRSPPP
jgi:hypothetical protein